MAGEAFAGEEGLDLVSEEGFLLRCFRRVVGSDRRHPEAQHSGYC
jgi:hypothetical protein